MNDRLLPAALIEEARGVDLVALIQRSVKLVRRGRAWWGRCPFHADGTPSFKVENERRAYKCFGCGAGGDAIAWLVATQNLSFVEAVRALTGDQINGKTLKLVAFDPASCGIYLRERDKTRIAAREIWDSAEPAKGSRVDSYLKARGIRVPPTGWSELRYAPRLRHTRSKRYLPAMIARVADERGLCAIQRTYLDPDEPKKADVMPAKMSLGQMEGGAVRLRPANEVLGLAEGIETALSASQLYSWPTWATLSCMRLSQIEIPPSVTTLVIFGDPGVAGQEEAFRAAEHYETKTRHVEVIFPAAHFEAGPKADFNAVLRENMARKDA